MLVMTRKKEDYAEKLRKNNLIQMEKLTNAKNITKMYERLLSCHII